MLTPAQEHEPDELTRMILDMETMTREVYSYVWEIEEGHGDDIDTMEIINFFTSIASIDEGNLQFPWTTCLGMTPTQLSTVNCRLGLLMSNMLGGLLVVCSK